MKRQVSRRAFLQVAASSALVAGQVREAIAHTQSTAAAPDWALNATIIEACSCTMFCPCYFSIQKIIWFLFSNSIN